MKPKTFYLFYGSEQKKLAKFWTMPSLTPFEFLIIKHIAPLAPDLIPPIIGIWNCQHSIKNHCCLNRDPECDFWTLKLLKIPGWFEYGVLRALNLVLWQMQCLTPAFSRPPKFLAAPFGDPNDPCHFPKLCNFSSPALPPPFYLAASALLDSASLLSSSYGPSPTIQLRVQASPSQCLPLLLSECNLFSWLFSSLQHHSDWKEVLNLAGFPLSPRTSSKERRGMEQIALISLFFCALNHKVWFKTLSSWKFWKLHASFL